MIPEPLKKFIDLFSKIPGVGLRQAYRIAFWFLKHNKAFMYAYGFSLKEMADTLAVCSQCFFVFEKRTEEQTFCVICSDKSRDHTVIAVVEKETDLISIEKTKQYRGLYHILGGLITPDEHNNHDLRLKELMERIDRNPQTKEIILAISHTAQGDLTAMELEKMMKPFAINITRLGLGLPRGAEVEFADEDTLSNAIRSRK
ncbi:MAG: Recombination protein RecR [Parcubacteria group bacterium GW2011_GWB1_46_8]|nr:MAG: Recombination protein RecR [Parcubacteria group bacterium GW2011_GWF1_45_5]KKU10658.1 MAG: Recombination protein RecR [Parcubacteria group bacterium GW2011_GWA1_45_7]KKU43234.1 MAG: Recombination protein RecR [Parcubacteria group bacterium GW2011_GWA2_46_7]KKU45940.1 MAG: Recombination protein RecR [Parcubacteria group bacterium GW2011_GWB1_46_8]